VDGGGDCEDTSILFATIVLILNYSAIFISPPNHLAVGVWGKDLHGSYYTFNSRTYYYCETTGENRKIGDLPDEYQDSRYSNLYNICFKETNKIRSNCGKGRTNEFIIVLLV